jgi:hypothetical protein
MQITRPAFIAYVALMLSGCAQIPPYQDATGQNTAKLRLRMEKPIMSNLFLSAVDLETCKPLAGFTWVSGGVDSLYTKKVGMLDSTPPEEGVLEFVIPANRPLAARTIMHIAKLNAAEIMLSMNPMMQGDIAKKQPAVCPAPGLLPKPGQQYEIAYVAQPGTCMATIYLLKQEGTAATRVDITRELNISVVNKGDGKFACEAP